MLVNPGLDHDGDPVLFVHLKFRLVKPGIDPRLPSDSAITLRRALWAIGECRFVAGVSRPQPPGGQKSLQTP